MTDDTLDAPPLGDYGLAGDLTCDYGLPRPICDKPAIVHFFWGADGENSLACADHADETRRRWAIYDEHPIGGVCTMPDTHVIWSWDDPPGRCLWQVSEDTMAAVRAAERESVHA